MSYFPHRKSHSRAINCRSKSPLTYDPPVRVLHPPQPTVSLFPTLAPHSSADVTPSFVVFLRFPTTAGGRDRSRPPQKPSKLGPAAHYWVMAWAAISVCFWFTFLGICIHFALQLFLRGFCFLFSCPATPRAASSTLPVSS